MTKKQLQSRLRRKLIMHMLFQIGGAVVIVGALFKILHLEIGPITGGLVLGVGLGTEAIIFLVGGLMTGDVKEEHDSFIKHNTEDHAAPVVKEAAGSNELVSSKIDELLKEAKLDVSLVESLTQSIHALHDNVKVLEPIGKTISSTESYSEQISKAASQMEELNNAYNSQLSSIGSNQNLGDEMKENSERLKVHMDNLANNIESLNRIYGGMLTAMTSKKD